MLEIRKAGQRGTTSLGWLKSRHSFSFDTYQDPDERDFSDLKVINDDRIAGGRGFGQHPHRDMEILTYVLQGALTHKDTLGNGSLIQPGDVQLMSAGSGVAHSEFNHSRSQPLHLLQVWISPKVTRGKPRYQQKRFAPADKRGRLCLIASPNAQDGSLQIQQDTRIYSGLFQGSENATLPLAGNRCVYVHVARGKLSVNGQRLNEGDGLKVRGENVLTLGSGIDAEVLVFELRVQKR
ncbi:pirin family protein [Pseudomonas sp. NA-150]|uniref:pirin family protein n=1 Tax=Pseudomonas sp. NA-150 TaxID=3367525 RepID=UPI0037CB3C8E